jgi:purine nucleoside phosphorylase
MQSSDCTLDEAVRAALAKLLDRGTPRPAALYLLATGTAGLADELAFADDWVLAEVPGVPELWQQEILHTGRLGSLDVWLLADASGDPFDEEPGEAWQRGFPLWLAAAAGASVCVHTSVGSALDDEPRAPVPGAFVALRDHLNLSGASPLIGLRGSALGPLFPDLSLLHHLGLRRAALGRAEELGLPVREGVAACTAGPALETPAERRMLARAGADLSVQGLATPLLAAAHAGLRVLALSFVSDAGEPADVARLVEAAAEAQPALDELLHLLAEDVAQAVSVLSREP